MGRMKSNERAVKSIPDKAGNVYSKTANGGKARTQAAINYMDKHENEQLYTLDKETGEFRETDRYDAGRKLEDSETKYQQHVVFTTDLKSGEAYVNKQEYAEMVARSVQERRPDADIYAVSVHTDKEGEGHVHAHVVFGTNTTLRNRGEGNDLQHFRQEAHRHEQHIREHGKDHELTHDEHATIEHRRESVRASEQQHERKPSRAHREDMER